MKFRPAMQLSSVLLLFLLLFAQSAPIFAHRSRTSLDATFMEDISGLEIIGEGEDFKTYTISDVEADSPAAAAGIREEDILVAIDGRAASALTLDEIRRMLMQNERKYLLTLKRGDETIQTRLKLKVQSTLDPKF